MKTKYKEIFKLKRMLEKEGIPFEFIDHSIDLPDELKYNPLFTKDQTNGKMEHYQICYPSQGENRWISVIEGFGTYGERQDKLEIMDGFNPYEEFSYGGRVMGYLTANNVFKRIKNHYEGKL